MYNTPYDRWIADQVYVTNMKYAAKHAFANELFNTARSVREAEAHMPPITYQQPRYVRAPRISDIMGGITGKNMEGGLDGRYGDDNKIRSFNPAPFARTYGYGYGRAKPDSDSDESESESDEETENRIIGGASTALPAPYMKSTGNQPGNFIGTGKKGMLPEPMPAQNVIVSGAGAKKTSPWIAHVKKWAADHKMSYRDALRDADMKKAYHSSKKGGFIPLLPLAASLIAPSAVKLVSSGVKSLWNKIRGKGKSAGSRKIGGEILFGPSNDPVNGPRLAKNESDFGVVSDGDDEMVKKMKRPAQEGAGKLNDAILKFKKERKMKKELASKKVVAPAAPVAAVADVGAGKRRSKKTGSALFSIKGVVPMSTKDAPPPPEDIIRSDGQSIPPLPSEAQAAAISTGGKKARKPRAKKFCMPVPELVKEHEQLVKVLEDKSGSHQALMKKEAAKQKKELKKYKKMDDKKARAPSAWIKHVQAYAKQHGCSYKEAMSKAKATYKK